MKILIIIPALNEELNIGGVIDDLKAYVPEANLLVVNDGSTDSTAEIAYSYRATVINLPFNLGIGAAMQAGFKYAERNGYDIAVQFDGDGQHRADQLQDILNPIIDGNADITIGSRFINKGLYDAELPRLVGIRILSRIISIFIGQKITDPTSGFRAVNRKVIEFYSRYYPDDYPEPEALVLLHRAGFRIHEVPTLMRKRLMGNSSITIVKAIYYMIKVILAITIDIIKKVPGR
jgi:glycosyltransferase involved in cell wall biosynthesis